MSNRRRFLTFTCLTRYSDTVLPSIHIQCSLTDSPTLSARSALLVAHQRPEVGGWLEVGEAGTLSVALDITIIVSHLYGTRHNLSGCELSKISSLIMTLDKQLCTPRVAVLLTK